MPQRPVAEGGIEMQWGVAASMSGLEDILKVGVVR